MEKNNLKKSKLLYERAKKVAPAGVHSPVRAFRAVGGTPIFFEKGQGANLWDVDGNKYIDFCMSWGALSIGHAHPNVVAAIQKQAERGTHYGTPTPHDVELAELVLSAIGPYEKIRFVSSGTEAVMTAVRLARGYTGRKKIVKVEGSYHGHMDALLVSAGSGLVTNGVTFSAGVTPGIIADTLVIPYNSQEALKEVFQTHGDDIAAIIVEPIMANNGLFEFDKEWFQLCRDITHAHKSLLIFDEVITGFRVAWGGAKSLYKMEPDIGTYGKILGGGMPVGAVAARAEIMDALAPNGKVYQAGTLSGNPIAMVAGIANLRTMKEINYYEKVAELGIYLDQKIKQLQNESLRIPLFYRRIEGIFWLCPGTTSAPASPEHIGDAIRNAFKETYHKILSQGVYISPSVFEVGFISSAHTKQDLDALVGALRTAST